MGIVKLTPKEFFEEVHEEGKPSKYQWSGGLGLVGSFVVGGVVGVVVGIIAICEYVS